jgi:hypothetical protein
MGNSGTPSASGPGETATLLVLYNRPHRRMALRRAQGPHALGGWSRNQRTPVATVRDECDLPIEATQTDDGQAGLGRPAASAGHRPTERGRGLLLRGAAMRGNTENGTGGPGKAPAKVRTAVPIGGYQVVTQIVTTSDGGAAVFTVSTDGRPSDR